MEQEKRKGKREGGGGGGGGIRINAVEPDIFRGLFCYDSVASRRYATKATFVVTI